MGSLKMCLVRFWAAFFVCVGFFWGVVCLAILVFRLPLGELSGSLKMGLRFVVSFGCGVYHALRASGALTFFASPKKVSKERRPRRAGSLRELPSLRILFSARAN